MGPTRTAWKAPVRFLNRLSLKGRYFWFRAVKDQGGHARNPISPYFTARYFPEAVPFRSNSSGSRDHPFRIGLFFYYFLWRNVHTRMRKG